MLNLIAPGSACDIGPEDNPIGGAITAVAVYPSQRILYQVAWWNGGERREQWLDAFEVRAQRHGDRCRIGFLPVDGPE